MRRRIRAGLLGPEGVGEAAHNFRCVYGDAFWMGILNGVAGTFTNVFAVRLGAPDFYLGLMAAGPALITILATFPAVRLLQRYSRQRVKLVVGGRIMNRMAYFLIALMPFFLPAHLLPLALMITTILMSLPGALMINLSVTSVLAEVIPAERRSQVIGMRYALMGISNTFAVLVGGKVLDLMPFPGGYQLIFAVAAATSFASIYYFNRFRIPQEALDSEARPKETPSAPTPPKKWRESLRELGRTRSFVIFLGAYMVFQLGMAAPGPLFSIYWVRNLNASDSWIGLLAMVGNAATVIAYFPWGNFATRRGNRLMLTACALGVSLYPIVTGLSPTIQPLLGLSLFSGVVSAGLNIALFNVLLEVTPSRGRGIYLAMHTALVNVSSLLGPLLGTALSSQLGVVPALFITGGLRILGASLFAFLPKGSKAQRD